MRMKNIIALLSVMLAVCFLGCSKENIPAGEEVSSGEGIELSISLNGEFDMDSRSALTSSEPMHHIEHMYAYVFAADQGNELTIDNAKCIYEEKLPWTGTAEGATVFRCRMKPENFDYNTPDREYLVMVVGVDNNKDTYAFPWEGVLNSEDKHLGMKDKRLKEVKIALADGIDASQMSHTELFAGFHKFTTKEQLVNVKLSRRVAGVICYLTDIPATISVGADETYQIVGVQLHCNGGLNTEGVLIPDLTPDVSGNENFQDYLLADEKNESTLLAETDLHALGAETGPDPDRATLYIPAINQEGVFKTLPNTALMGAYMLPVKEGAQFSIRLVGAKISEGSIDMNVKKVFDATDTDGYYLVKQQGSAEETYPVNADYVYNIGYKPYTADTDYDQPLSLKGKDFTVVPSDWRNTVPDINVDFPTVAIGIILDTGKTINHRYDCISGTDNMNVKLLRPDFTADNGYTWKIEVAYTKNHDEDADGNRSDWIDFNGNDLTGSGEKTIHFTVKEYVNDRNLGEGYNPDEDYREATLTLSVYKDGKSIYQTKSYIRQWNALIVKSYDEDGNELPVHRAFRRLDNGASFNDDGSVNYSKVITYPWAKMNLPATVLYANIKYNTGDNGLTNYSKMKDVATDGILPNCETHWSNCVINTAAEINEKGEGWYVPARIELHALMFYMYNFKTAFLSNDVNWWSATCVGITGDTRYYSNNSIFDDVNENDLYKYKDLKAEIGFQYRVRQATQDIQPVKNE